MAFSPTQTPALVLLPGRVFTLVLLRLEDGSRLVLAQPPAQLLEALRSACALLGFGGVQRAEPMPEELLPWAGNV